jgi:Glycosyl hydrolase family 10
MGTTTFQLPAEVSADAVRELEHSYLAGGPDNMPWVTFVQPAADDQLQLIRPVEESGYLSAPWSVSDGSLLMSTTGTLMERPRPYHLLVELARGKVNQVRCQESDWRAGGLAVHPQLHGQIQKAGQAFGQAVTQMPSAAGERQAQDALNQAFDSAAELVHAYVEQVFQIRHQRQPRLDTTLACRLGPTLPDAALTGPLAGAFNAVYLPLAWNLIENTEASYRWDQTDALVDWALKQPFDVTAGPLIDFSSAQLPAWLWLWEGDVPSLATFMCKFIEMTVRRYRTRVRRWQLTAASNWARVLGLGEEELLGLTYRLIEAARQVDPGLELMFGVAQPWGEYMAKEERTHSPFIFADTLIRSGVNPWALDVEVVMGVTPRGSYCRDLLETSRLLDLYALLGVPLRVTLGYPSGNRPDTQADPEAMVGLGRWRSGFTPAVQADWAALFAELSVCKPYVQGVQWTHFSDAQPHQFPHCGLLDAQGDPKPALARLAALRAAHLR